MVDLGDFWDLSDLIPKKKKSTAPQPFKQEIPLSEIRQPLADEQSHDDRTLTLSPANKACEESYEPIDNPLIRRVTVTARETGYSFYAQFRRNAEAYLDRHGEKCPYVPFFSYIPQYSQLSADQLAYYFYFRDALSRGETPKVDYSYFWLYVYEIINLPDLISPNEGVIRLCRAWRLYREQLPKIDKYMTVWLTDYCLLHRLPCPIGEIRDFLDAAMEHSDFKEFYLGGISSLNEDGTASLLAMLSDYHFDKSRYASGEFAEVFRRHMIGVMTEVFRVLFSDGRVVIDTAQSATIKREAFSGSLCSHNIKRTLTVEYLSFRAAKGLRDAVTAAVKYAENKLRSYLSIKSRLSVPRVDSILFEAVDRYFSTLFLQRESERRASERPAYESLYEAESRPLSFEGAEEIESRSWENARLLVPEEESMLDLTPAAEPLNSPALHSDSDDTEDRFDNGDALARLSHADAVYLHATLIGDDDERKWVLSTLGMSEDALAERINLAFTEEIGDIVLEPTEDGYIVIEDYMDEVIKWTENRLGTK